MIEAIRALSAGIEGAGAAGAQPGSSLATDFVARLEKRFEEVNQDVLRSEASMRDLAAGKAVSLHQVVIDMEQAKLSVQMMMSVRTRILEAYQELLRMQV